MDLTTSTFYNTLVAFGSPLSVWIEGNVYLATVIGSSGDLFTLEIDQNGTKIKLSMHYTNIVIAT